MIFILGIMLDDMISLINDEVLKLGLPLKVDISADLLSKAYYRIGDGMSSVFIHMDINGLSDGLIADISKETDRSYLDFWYNEHAKSLEINLLRLNDDLKGNRYGVKLVGAVENFGVAMGCIDVRVYDDNNANKRFWDHMGYSFHHFDYCSKIL